MITPNTAIMELAGVLGVEHAAHALIQEIIETESILIAERSHEIISLGKEFTVFQAESDDSKEFVRDRLNGCLQAMEESLRTLTFTLEVSKRAGEFVKEGGDLYGES
jgi:hypothetical protein